MDINVLMSQGDTYIRVGKYKEALNVLTQVIHLDQKMVEAHFNRGMAYNMTGQPEKALNDFIQVIHLDPYNTGAYYNRGLIYSEMHRYEEALNNFTQVIELNPKHTKVYMDRGLIYGNIGQYENARNDFFQAIKLNHPNLAWAYTNIGVSYNKQGDPAKALPHLEKAAELFLKAADLGSEKDAADYYNVLMEIQRTKESATLKNPPHVSADDKPAKKGCLASLFGIFY